MTSPQSYLDALPSALIATDRKLRITYMNQTAEALFAINAQQMSGTPIAKLLGLSESEEDRVSGVFATSEDISLYERMIEPTFGQRIKTNVYITPVAGAAGKIEQALFTIEKSTKLHSLNASEWKKEITRASGVMAAMLAHEVKNPLAGIRGAAQFLKDEIPDEHQSLINLICLETERIRDLLAQVEIFATGAPELQPVNIHEVLQYVISIASTGFAKQVRIKENYDPSLPMVRGHRDLLVQLVLNLVKNAAEAVADRKDAAITLTTLYRSGYRICQEGNNMPVPLPVAVYIEDNGPGIAEALRPRLFEPFASSKEEGRGLGLAVVAKIAADLGAVVELDADFTGGTRFAVWLAVDR